MSILNAIALAGLAFLAVPILIHLIHRQRYPRVRFSTLRFFDRTRKHNVIQRRLIDIILLVLRLAALAALALGLARPVITAGSGARASVVIVLDNSPSMAAIAEGKQTAFDLAKAKAADALNALHEGDRACLILTSRMADGDFTADKQALIARAGELAGCSVLLRTRSGKGSVMSPTAAPQAIRAAIQRLPDAEEAAIVPRHDAQPELTADLAALRRRMETARVAWRRGSVNEAAARAHELLSHAGDAACHLFVFSDFASGTDAPPAPIAASPRVRVHTAWSKWPLEPAFVPLMQQLVKYLASPDRGLTALAGGVDGLCTPGGSLLASVEKSFRAGASAAYRREPVDGRERLVPVAVEQSTARRTSNIATSSRCSRTIRPSCPPR